MKISKKIVSIVLVWLLALTAVPMVGAVPESELPEGLSYYIDGYGKHSEAVISKYTGNAEELVIPDTIEGYPVTMIEHEVFSNCTSLESVTIGKNVNFIQYGAFMGCTNLSEIKILGTVTSLQEDVFLNTAFYNNEANWENGVLYIDGHTIKAKDTLSGSYTLKDSTKVLAWGSFRGCGELTEIIIPDSVTVIGKSSFFGCSKLSKVDMSENIVSMGYLAFMNTAFYDDKNNWENGCLYLGKYLLAAESWEAVNVTVKEGTELIAVSAFFECGELETITFPESVKYINQEAFWRCTDLHTITLPQGITSIERTTFRECANLRSITIPEGVVTIGDYAFYDSGLETIILPDTIEYFGTYAFDSDEKSVYIYDEESFWGNFPNDSNLLTNARVYYMDKLTTEHTFPDNITSVSAIVSEYTTLESVIIPNPEIITEIEDYAFTDCKNLKYFTMPENVIKIGRSAFNDCISWLNPVVPEKVQSIGAYAYYNCNITDFTLPSCTTYIGCDAFCDTPFYNNADNWSGNALYKDNVLLKYDQNATDSEYIVETGTRLIADSAFSFNDKIRCIEIPDTVTIINDKAFYYCTNLTSITIPESVTEIGKDCFAECKALTIYGYANSVAESYAKENDIKFESIGTSINTTPTITITTEPDSEPAVTKPTTAPDSKPVEVKPTTEPDSEPVVIKPTSTASDSNPSDVPVSPSGKIGLEAEVANQETGDVLFTYSGIRNAYYYELTFYDFSGDVLYTKSSETTEYTWAPEDNFYGTVKVTAKDNKGKTLEESSLYSYILMDNEIQLAGNYGDADENFKINIKDATAIQKHLANIIELNEFAVRLADANGDSKVNIKDATTIQKHCANLKPKSQIGVMLTDSYIQKEIFLTEEADSTDPTEATDGTTGDFVEPPVTTEATEPAEIVKPTIAIPTETTEATKPTVQVITTEATEPQKPTVQIVTTEATVATEATDGTNGDDITEDFLSVVLPDGSYEAVKVGDTFTYSVMLKTDNPLNTIDGSVSYDGTKLKITDVNCDNLETKDVKPVVNADLENMVSFNTVSVKTPIYFNELKPMITIEFEAVDSGETDITHKIECLGMSYTDEYYYNYGNPVTTEGIALAPVIRTDESTLSVIAGNTAYSGNIGDTFTYYLELEAEELFEDIQGYVTYDHTKLKLNKKQNIAEYLPILSKQIEDMYDFGASDDFTNKVTFAGVEITDGFDFTEKRTLVMLEFEVIGEGYAEISHTIEEMGIFYSESDYFDDSKQLITDGITLTTSFE